ncbi:hypothetical protein O181_026855 [Austropuccinia psidii MF-1]|uniref:J domain-containing protein n=1 Tax=Austropuccinia psidii MF-1 TaxID=1389203 RepID=A0A9Q3CQ11_9BASI|nr:hypothetical protein [Austropuccinia psidii MF-1]
MVISLIFPSNLYDRLGVKPDADLETIKKAYRRKALQFHPDKNSTGAEEFKAILEAYEILTDPNKRKSYDQQLQKEKLNTEPDPVNMDPDNLFAKLFLGENGIFGDYPPIGQNKKRFSCPIIIRITSSKETIQIYRVVVCPECQGDGLKPGSIKPCPSCCPPEGHTAQQSTISCTDCSGLGKIVILPYQCHLCKGDQIVKQHLSLKAKFITIRGQANETLKREPHVLDLVIEAKPYVAFRPKETKVIVGVVIDFTNITSVKIIPKPWRSDDDKTHCKVSQISCIMQLKKLTEFQVTCKFFT